MHFKIRRLMLRRTECCGSAAGNHRITSSMECHDLAHQLTQRCSRVGVGGLQARLECCKRRGSKPLC